MLLTMAFIDFDGTIFMQDTGHILFNSFGCGSDRRGVLDEQIKSGERSFRDVSEEMWGAFRLTFPGACREKHAKYTFQAASMFPSRMVSRP